MTPGGLVDRALAGEGRGPSGHTLRCGRTNPTGAGGALPARTRDGAVATAGLAGAARRGAGTRSAGARGQGDAAGRSRGKRRG